MASNGFAVIVDNSIITVGYFSNVAVVVVLDAYAAGGTVPVSTAFTGIKMKARNTEFTGATLNGGQYLGCRFEPNVTINSGSYLFAGCPQFETDFTISTGHTVYMQNCNFTDSVTITVDAGGTLNTEACGGASNFTKAGAGTHNTSAGF